MNDIDNMDSYSFNPHAPMESSDFTSNVLNQKEVASHLERIKRECNARYTAVDYLSDCLGDREISLRAAKELLSIVKIEPDSPNLDYLQRQINWYGEQA